ncbi:unnamed protein product [Aphanomyces euteiches]|uniref:Tyrosinase copper-binding domain-containing protein n=1 Tax=Aphanomyces euteiches TaxID=100861 RepID=A0A6G0WG51_9STRA|nr:hypothetical protein Ae201684_015651 [Aphanomyces euteiches]KAH9094084.1 hypothetical protein Ae201684P_016700 [Aphanomyces euteiches]KAH9141440.1 hypothetical protein AeRB84_014382 [Aphanomyces euteiches]
MQLHWLILVVGVLATIARSQPYPCSGETYRVRKAWSMLSSSEKSLFQAALDASMAAGYYHHFFEMHTEATSSAEAHGCMFFYWHRKFLLGFENMLRSLSPSYACVTIPYWDYATLASNYVSNSCASIYSCASDMINNLGGNGDPWSGGRTTWSAINGQFISASRCVQQYPLNRFCQSHTAFINRQCMGCVPRDDLRQWGVPSESNIVGVFNQILGGSSFATGKTFQEVTNNVQLGCHNAMHARMHGSMMTFNSPADLIFFLHHAQMDLMHTIYFKCIVADTTPGKVPVLTDAQKRFASDYRLWTNCSRVWTNSVIRPTDPVRMFYSESGQPSKNISDPTGPLYKFFASLPDSYYQYADSDDIKNGSYRYQYTGFLASMLTRCKKFIVPWNAVMLQDDYNTSTNPSYTDRCIDRPPLPCEVNQTSFMDYVSNLAGQREWTEAHLQMQLEAMVCSHHHECLGGCFDYSDEFKALFRPKGPPRCKVIIDRIAKRRMTIELRNWRQIMAKYFPCPDAEIKAQA